MLDVRVLVGLEPIRIRDPNSNHVRRPVQAVWVFGKERYRGDLTLDLIWIRRMDTHALNRARPVHSRPSEFNNASLHTIENALGAYIASTRIEA